MNRNNYTSSRSYENGATLFINPSKKNSAHTKRKSGKPSLILSFLIVILIFSSIIGYSAYAENANRTVWEPWSDDEHLYIDAFGSMNKADIFAISLSRNNCEGLRVDFYINSRDLQEADIGQKFMLEVTEASSLDESSDGYKNEVYVSYSQKMSGNIVYILSFEENFKTQDWLDRLDSYQSSNFNIDIVEHANYSELGNGNPSFFFQHTENMWDLSNLRPILGNAYRECRLVDRNKIEV